MPAKTLQINSLVLYKTRPARVLSLGEKIEIELEGAKTKKVRDKDVSLLHPGPFTQLKSLNDQQAEVSEAWELLEGEATSFGELLELVFEQPTPADAWSLWLVVADGMYFSGEPEQLQPRSGEEMERLRSEREAKANAERDWADFLQRLRQQAIIEADHKRLAEVERVAYGISEQSRILEALQLNVSPENAYRLLVELGYWPQDHNPHPGRQGLETASPDYQLPELPEEVRDDFSHLPAFAIDDERSNDPDDAISLEGERIWVHVADVAALVAPDSELDLEARARGTNLYLPEVISSMLPPPLTEQLGLGLQPQSPALSIGFRLDEQDQLTDIDIRLTRLQVTRVSYNEANGRMQQEPFASLHQLTERYRARRLANGAAGLDLPEVSIKLVDGRPLILPMERLDSREMVTDAMLMAGEAVALYCTERQIPIPYVVQVPPDPRQNPETLSGMYAYRRFFKPSQSSVNAGLHAGLGLQQYTRATSPLRRYQDLLVHQQLRAHLRGTALLSESEIGLRVAQADEGAAVRRRTERFSNQHWKLVWLQQHPDWQGEGVVVELDERKATLLLPELALETKIRLRDGLALDQRLQLQVREVSLPDQSVYFRIRS